MRLLALFLFISLSISQALGNCNKEKVILGYDDWRPYQFKEGGKVTGLDVDLLSAILKSTGCPFKLKAIGWGQLMFTEFEVTLLSLLVLVKLEP